MIKCDEGMVQIEGNKLEIQAELAMVISAFHSLLTREMGDEQASSRMLKDICDIALLSKEEREEATVAARKELMRAAYNVFSKGNKDVPDDLMTEAFGSGAKEAGDGAEGKSPEVH